MQFLPYLFGLGAFHLDCLAVLLDSITVVADELGILTLLFTHVTFPQVTLELDDSFDSGLNESKITLFLDISDSYSLALSSMSRDF